MAPTNRRDEIMTTLTEGIARLTSSDRWAEWLAVQSRFHKYSFRNTLLILTQRPDASRVAGFRAWQSMGRQVAKGEKAIWILAPVTRKVGDVDPEVQPDAPDGKGRVLVAFKPACVFDIAQTYGEELPEVCSRLEGEDITGAFGRLTAVAQSIGYTVSVLDFPGTANGDCSFDQRLIRVREGNAPAQRVKTLAHEIAHAMLHENWTDRQVAELEAESIAFVVCSNLNLASDDYSFGYCASWAGGGDEAVAAIKASGERIQKTADAILRSLDELQERAA